MVCRKETKKGNPSGYKWVNPMEYGKETKKANSSGYGWEKWKGNCLGNRWDSVKPWAYSLESFEDYGSVKRMDLKWDDLRERR